MNEINNSSNEKIKVVINKKEAPNCCEYCDDGIAEYNCYACGRKLCFFCVKRIKDKIVCFFHYTLYQAFKSSVEQFKVEESKKGGEKI